VAGALIVTYGAYIPSDVNLPRAGLTITICDSLVAVIAGLAIFPIVFGFGLDAAGGPGLLFVTLPVAFASPWIFTVWLFLIRFVCPPALIYPLYLGIWDGPGA
jgi:NSS family neurotransmitter:Na+ symporter